MSITRRLFFALVPLGLAAVVAALPAVATRPALGQLKIAVEGKAEKAKEEPSKDGYVDAVTLPTNREAHAKIKAIPAYIKREEWDKVTKALQELLDFGEDSFIEIRSKEADGQEKVTKVSIRVQANRLLGQLPKEGRDFYEVTYGGSARGLLTEAVQKNDPALLAQVSQRYLHTRAGAQATELLGNYYLDKGEYLSAALFFERLSALPDVAKLTPKVLFKYSLAERRQGNAAKSRQIWEQLSEQVGRGAIPFGRANLTLEQLKAELDRATADVKVALADWPMVGGNPARNGQGNGGTPFLDQRWVGSLLPQEDPLDTGIKAGNVWITEKLAQVFSESANKPQQVLIPAFQPIAAAGRIIYRGYDGVYAVASKDDAAQGIKAGDLAWIMTAEHSLHGMVKEPGPRSIAEGWWNFYKQQGPLGIFFENSLIGSLSHDGQRAYFIDDIGMPPHPSIFQQFQMNNQPMVFSPQFQDAVLHNRLRAVDLESGKLLWDLGGRSTAGFAPKDDKKDAGAREAMLNELLDAHFLGAPLPLDGKIYVLLEKNAELKLACINPNKMVDTDKKRPLPEILWMQTLGTANQKVFLDGLRRPQAVHLAFSDGILVCPTNAGAVLGIDLLSHSLVWAHSYRKTTAAAAGPGNPNVAVFKGGGVAFQPGGPGMPGGGNLNAERWRTTPPVIDKGRVIFAAYDSEAVHVLDLRNGEMVLKNPITRTADDLYLGGVYDNKVLIVGKEKCRAVNLSDGVQAWEVKTGTPSGIGAASDNHYYLPLKAGEIAVIDLARGVVKNTAKSRKKEAPGNLLFAEGEVYSQTPHAVIAYPQLQVKIAEMNRRLQADPKDPIGLLERGELNLDDGNRAEAVNDLRASLANNPPADARAKAREKLHEALTELLQHDFPKGKQFLDEYKDLCKIDVPSGATPPQRERLQDEQLRRDSTYLSLVAKGREDEGDLSSAFDHYMAFGSLAGNKELLDIPGELNTKARPDVFARGRIENMIRKATDAQRKPLQDKIAGQWKEVREANDPEKLREFVHMFGSLFTAGREARLYLAERLIESGGEDDLRDAQLHLLQLRSAREEPQIAARAVEALARLMVRKGLLEDAVGYYRELGRDFAAVEVRDGKTGADFLNDLLTDKRFLPYLEPARMAWHGKFKAQDVTGNFPANTQVGFTIEPEGELSAFYQRHRLVIDVNAQGSGMWQLRVVDRITDDDRCKFYNLPPCAQLLSSNTAQPRFAQARGHLLLLNLNHMVYAFDLAEKKKLWEYNLFGKVQVQSTQPVNTMFDADGSVRLVYADGWMQRLGQVGVIESSYVCLQTREGLVALDPARGPDKILWQKAGSPRVQVFGDAEYVFVVETDQEGRPAASKAVRARDGLTVKVPDFATLFQGDKKVRVLGRKLLLFEQAGEGKLLRLYDIPTGKDVWTRPLPAKAILMKSEDPELIGFVTPDGKAKLIEVASNKEIITAELAARHVSEHLDKVNEAHVVFDREQYYVCLNRPQEGRMSLAPSTNNGIRVLRLNGVVYAFDRATHQYKWFTHIEDTGNQWLILEQFQDLPLFLAAAMQTKVNNNGTTDRSNVRVTGIDKRNGKLVYSRDLSPFGQFYAVSTDLRLGTIELWRPDMKVRFVPEASAAQTADAGRVGAALPLTAEEEQQRARQRFQAVQQAIKVNKN